MSQFGRREFMKWSGGLLTVINSRSPGSFVRAQTPQAGHVRLDKNGRFFWNQDWCTIPAAQMYLRVDDQRLDLQLARLDQSGEASRRLRYDFLEEKLSWEIETELNQATGSILLRTFITNHSDQPVSLQDAVVLETDRVDGLSSPGDKLVYLPILTGQQLIQLKNLADSDSAEPLALQIFNRSQAKALQVGFASFQRLKSTVRHTYSSGQLGLRASCDFAGWELPPGSTIATEDFLLGAGADPHAQLESWADQAARLCRPQPREWEEAPVGWLGWSWVDGFHVERYEDVVMRNLDAIRDRLAGFGVEYVWISIANIENGQPGDWLNWNYGNFPKGPRYLRRQLEQRGFKWGLWCGAFMVSRLVADEIAAGKEALYQEVNGGGPRLYRKQWPYGLNDPEAEPPGVYALDPTHPESQRFLQKVFQTYRDWGVRYYMIDFLSAVAENLGPTEHFHHHDRTIVPGPGAMRKGLETIREACGDDTYLLASSGPTIETAGFMDAVRTGMDFGEGRPLIPAFGSYPATTVINLPEYWQGPVNAISNQAATYFTHRKLYLNDSGNVLTVDKPLQLSEAQVFATIHALSGGPTMLGDDIEMLDEERLNLIKCTLPRPKEVAFPVDLFSRKAETYPRIFHRKVVRPWGRFDIVAVYNLEPDQVIEEAVELHRLGLDSETSYLAWEFWGEEYLGKIRNLLVARVPPRSVKVYRLVKDQNEPLLLGTDMHLLMGEMEVDSLTWERGERILKGQAIRPSGEKGSIFIHAPSGMALSNPKGFLVAKDGREDALIIRCPLNFEDGLASWKMQFRDLKE